MRQAYEAKKWGFVPDYARLDIVYEYGGIYLDTDVEMLKSFDELLEQDGFMGFENTGDGEYFVNCGHGFGAVPHHEVIRTARDLYNTISFLNADGTPNLLASPHFTTQALREFGLVQENRDQQLPFCARRTSAPEKPKKHLGQFPFIISRHLGWMRKSKKKWLISRRFATHLERLWGTKSFTLKVYFKSIQLQKFLHVCCKRQRRN